MTCKGKCCKYKSPSYNESFQHLYWDPLLAKRGSTVLVITDILSGRAKRTVPNARWTSLQVDCASTLTKSALISDLVEYFLRYSKFGHYRYKYSSYHDNLEPVFNKHNIKIPFRNVGPGIALITFPNRPILYSNFIFLTSNFASLIELQITMAELNFNALSASINISQDTNERGIFPFLSTKIHIG